MIKTIGVVLMSALLLVFLSGCGQSDQPKPGQPAKAEHPTGAPAKPEHPTAAPAKPDQPKPEHPKAEPAK
jgi:hypothetical protein